MVTFNYACINDKCIISGNVPIKKDREDEEREEICHECNQPLKCIGEMTNMVIRGDIHTRMLRNQAHFKQRAKKHANTPEQKHLKQKRQDQEFAKMGIHKKK